MGWIDWQIYYMGIAKAVSANCKCLSRKIGAILVNPKNGGIIATGYNGPPMGTPHCNDIRREASLLSAVGDRPKLVKAVKNLDIGQLKECPRRPLGFQSGKGLEICVAGHAERNAILNAARNGVKTDGVTMYAYCGRPCKDCCIEIINAGIRTVVYIRQEQYYDETSGVLLDQAGIQLYEMIQLEDGSFAREWKDVTG